MKTNPTFDELMLALEQPLKEFQKLQKRKKRQRLIRRIIIGLLIIIIIVYVSEYKEHSLFIVGILLVLMRMLGGSSSRKEDKFWGDTIVSPILNRLIEAGTYKGKRGMPENMAMKNTFLSKYDNYKSSDLIEGRIGKVSYSIANIIIKESSGEESRISFQGVLFVANLAKRYDTRITVWFPALVKKNEDQQPEVTKGPSDRPVFGEFSEAWEVITKPIRNVLISLPESIVNQLRIEIYEHQFMITVPRRYFQRYGSVEGIVSALEEDCMLITAFTTIAGELDSNPALWGKSTD
ncbi:hypothetical protein M2137_001327 [Parabacteroides sp. PFB2-10]|uniref:hypothetical protein n=1 Tax=Parabacteroides sp. PFB2-10 TaxID=1742405 RepID=UPI002474302E|nr:hypothetical protein [Parabacteroides sp. PFB2-10]MDH6312556.1 hypothetical protein [Parabacteroides sp. PFB2-10]